MVNTFIKNGTIITMDEKNRIIHKGSIVIEDEKIVNVGETTVLKKEYAIDREIDANDKVVLPGLVNGHSHTWYNLFRNLKENMTITNLIPEIISPIVQHVKEDEIYIGSLLSFIEMIKSGTTCFLDNPRIFVRGKSPVEATVMAMKKMGIRGIIAPGVTSHEGIDTAIKNFNELIKKHRKADRIQIWPSAMTPQPRELLIALNQLAEKFDTGITTHLAETREAVEETLDMYGKRHVSLLAETGLLGPKFVGAHAIWLEDSEINLLAESGSSIVYAPGSVMSQGSGISPITKMLTAGVNVALGSDGAAFNVDMIEEMRLSALIQKGINLDPTCLSAQTVLEMATINGAKALLLDQLIGSIENGKKADIIIIDLKKPHTVPRHDVIQSLVYGASGNDVETVIIDGNIVMHDGNIVMVDEENVVNKAEEAAMGLVDRALSKT